MSPKVLLQYLVPHRLPTRFMYALARWRFRPFKNAMIRTIARLYGVDMAEAADPVVENYPHFDAFFTRALKPGARVPDPDPDAVLMPADGRISRVGRIRDGVIIQAKAHDYSVARLLGDERAAESYRDGTFATIYLSPRDYHRVHTPLPGRVLRTLHVPGKLFSVAPFTVDAVPELFARNERVICVFDSLAGPLAVVFVGALIVGSIETAWHGEVRALRRRIERWSYDPAVPVERGAEIGRFNVGSTIIVLYARGRVRWDASIREGAVVRVGQPLGVADLSRGS